MCKRQQFEFTGDITKEVEIPEWKLEEHSNKKVWLGALAVLVVGALLFTVIMMFTSGGYTGLSIYDGEVRLTGANGFSIPLNDITVRWMEEDLPPVAGYSGEGTLQGKHEFEDGTVAVFAIESLKGPIVAMNYDGTWYYANGVSEEITKEIYDAVLKGIEDEEKRAEEEAKAEAEKQ